MTLPEHACMRKFLNNARSVVRIQTWDVEAAPPAKVAELLGAAWPRQTGTVIDGGAPGIVICLSPSEWLVLCEKSPADPSVEEFSRAFEGSAFRTTDMSQALTAARIEGEAACSMLAKGCALNLDPATFKVGSAVRTRMAGIPVVSWRTENAVFECLLTRSYAEYFQAWLDDAALEFEKAM
jgi:sarcosine oxidase subunit gamma